MIEIQATINQDCVEIVIHNAQTGNGYRLNKQYYRTGANIEDRAEDIATKIAEYLIRVYQEP